LSVFELVKEIKRNVLVKGKRFTFLQDIGTGPLHRMVACPKFWHEITA
jgi:hypothetical protein